LEVINGGDIVLMVMINDGSVEWWREAHIWCSTVVVLF
jgi:hypothetical protein